MPDNEVVETFTHNEHEWTIEGRNGRFYVVDDSNSRVGPFATAEEAKASVIDPAEDDGGDEDEGAGDAPEAPQEPTAA